MGGPVSMAAGRHGEGEQDESGQAEDEQQLGDHDRAPRGVGAGRSSTGRRRGPRGGRFWPPGGGARRWDHQARSRAAGWVRAWWTRAVNRLLLPIRWVSLSEWAMAKAASMR